MRYSKARSRQGSIRKHWTCLFVHLDEEIEVRGEQEEGEERRRVVAPALRIAAHIATAENMRTRQQNCRMCEPPTSGSHSSSSGDMGGKCSSKHRQGSESGNKMAAVAQGGKQRTSGIQDMPAKSPRMRAVSSGNDTSSTVAARDKGNANHCTRAHRLRTATQCEPRTGRTSATLTGQFGANQA